MSFINTADSRGDTTQFAMLLTYRSGSNGLGDYFGFTLSSYHYFKYIIAGNPTAITDDKYNTKIKLASIPYLAGDNYSKEVKYTRLLFSWFREGALMSKRAGYGDDITIDAATVEEANTKVLDYISKLLILDKEYITITKKEAISNGFYKFYVSADLSRTVNGGLKFGGANDNLTHVYDGEAIIRLKVKVANVVHNWITG